MNSATRSVGPHAKTSPGPLRVLLVGGLDRKESEYDEIAEQCGITILFHTGNVRGRGSAALVEAIRRADVIIVITDVNSHGGVWLARQTARKFGQQIELHRRFSPARLAARFALATTA